MERNESTAKSKGCPKQPAGRAKSGKKRSPRGKEYSPGSFSPGEAASALSAELLDEDRCREWILERLHPDGAHCLGCAEPILDGTTLHNFWQGNRCNCKNCGRWFSATSGSFLQNMQLTFAQVFLLASFADYLSCGLTLSRAAAALNISPDTVRIWQRRFKAIGSQITT